MEIKISVRNLVEFILRSGNIDNRHAQAPENAMQEGSRIHRMIQKQRGASYHAEVPLKYRYSAGAYDIVVEGRADGIEDALFLERRNGEQPKDTHKVIIEEIKGTYRNLERMKQPVGVHLAQAKCYAYIYANQYELQKIAVRMTYCNLMEQTEQKYFVEHFTYSELKLWFDDVMEQYRKWSDYSFEWEKKRTESVKALEFPFPYRTGQRELVGYVYQTICRERKLFIEAPTGVGKTISTVFPSIKAIGEEKAEKLFYFTAKTITRTVAEDAFSLLRERGLYFKTVTLTAKEKICFAEEVECNPEACPYAKGHYDRVNDAIYDLLIHEDGFGREMIEEYARKHQVCPFEMCLDMSLFADAVICDYNYGFDPHAYLRRFFGEGERGKYIFLVDEAHNLVERGREMYSAVLKKEDFLALKKVVKPYHTGLEKYLDKCNKELLEKKRECESYKLEVYIAPFVMSLNRLFSAMEKYLEDHEESPVRKEILEFYFEISHFLSIYEIMDESYEVYTKMEEDGSFMIRLFCVDPATNLKECMRKALSTVLFSATFLPIQYYKKLLGGESEDYEVYAHSVFSPEKRGLFIGSDVTSRYQRRSEQEYYNIAAYIHAITNQRTGNYMVFCPSHFFLENVYDAYMSYFHDPVREECMIQNDRMKEKEREEFLQRFQKEESLAELGDTLKELVHFEIEEEEEKSLLGFCVLGGIFSEGIDLKKDSLIGAIIVGTGLPQVCAEREILKNYFDERGDNGFDFAYRYPGMNKVLQAAGRVIRTESDVGIVALLDDRFLQSAYQRMFPREWESYEVVTTNQIGKRIEKFWNDWL